MANKKINQLVSKTAILSTDIFGIGDATTGQLFKKTIAELQAAIGGAVISVNGLVGTVVLDTDDIQELATPTNKYFTDARARGAISLTVTGNSGASTYSSGTGVLNVPTYTLAGLGGITASFLSGTSGISYNSTTGVISYSGTVYTDASIRALLSGGTGITYNSSTGAISYSGTVYTDSSVRALISMTTTGNSGASTYNNTTGVINVPEYTLAGLGGISLTSLSGGTGITYNSSTGAISYSGTVYTDASIRGLISLTTTGTSGASTYNSTTGVLNIPQYTTDLSGYLPLTGGTLTGALGGTSASFSGVVTTNGTSAFSGYGLTTKGTFGLWIQRGSVNDSGLELYHDGTNAIINSTYQTTGSFGGLLFYTSALTRLTIASNGAATFSGNVNIAVADPRLIIKKTSNSQESDIIFQENNNGHWILSDNATTNDFSLYNYNTATNNLYVKYSNGNIGIATSSPSYLLDVNGGIAIRGKSLLDASGYFICGSEGYRFNNNTDALNLFIIKNNGNVLINTASDNGERLYVSGDIRATGTITANSDLTLKKNLLKIENALEKVEQINGYTYEFKEDDSKRHAGVIAQEIQTVLPEIVNKGNDGILGVEYGNISALLIEAIKEQQTQINELKALLNK